MEKETPKVEKTPVEIKVDRVNTLLEVAEPNSISHDTYSGYTGYKPQFVVREMNKVFGHGKWGFNEISMVVSEPDDKGNCLAVANVEVWLEGVENTMSAYGQSRVTRGDTGDAMKGAQTDAIKKALSYFDIGQKAYFGLLKKPAVKTNETNNNGF